MERLQEHVARCFKEHGEQKAEIEFLRSQLATIKAERDYAACINKSCHVDIKELKAQLAKAKAVTSKDVDRMEGALKLIKSLESQLTSAQEEGWNAARESELYNLNDPKGEREKREQNYPEMFKTYGFAAARRERWSSFADWQASKGKDNG